MTYSAENGTPNGLSHLEFANTYGPIEWPGDCSECGLTASGCSWHIDGCCADCNHPEIERDHNESGRHHRNGHLLELDGCMWRCLHCRHVFDAAIDAELFWCGDDCTGKHPGDTRPIPPTKGGDQ